MATINLGTNLVTDCNGVLNVNGVEVFRLRERAGNGHLMVDFDIRAQDGSRIARVANNNVVYAAPGFTATHEPNRSQVIEIATSRVVACAEETGSDVVAVTGEFWIDGFCVKIFPDRLLAGDSELSGNEVSYGNRGITLAPGRTWLG